jgi:hypothetical protein
MRIAVGERFESSCAKVEAWLMTSARGCRRLSESELRKYRARQVVVGWRLPISFPDKVREIDVLLDADFPWQPPRIALADPPPFLTWPHIEQDGVVCLLPALAEIDPVVPVKAVQWSLAELARLVEGNLAGLHEDDFRSEFHSYWRSDPKALPIKSLLNPAGPSRRITVWRRPNYLLIGDDLETITRWIARVSDKPAKQSVEQGILIWLDQALLPREYPQTAADVLALAKRQGCETLLRELATDDADQILVVLGADTQNGPAFAAVTIKAPTGATRGPRFKTVHRFRRGFREGRVSPELVQKLFFGNGRLMRSAVERVDAAWVHGRGQDSRQPLLRRSHVGLIGCGSIGGGVATLLARAGVGQLTFIDPDDLTWANIGRHVLGASGAGKSKARELARQIERDLPHIERVNVYCCHWEQIARENPGVLLSCDLLICSTGDGGSERALNEWHLRHKRERPVIYGWTEPHACAGHAVVVVADGGCLECGLDRYGASRIALSTWDSAPTQLQEPACGAVYQPYGPIELQHVIAMISELAIDCLLTPPRTSEHRMWAGRRSNLEVLGGRWSPAFDALMGARSDGCLLRAKPFGVRSDCVACGAGSLSC